MGQYSVLGRSSNGLYRCTKTNGSNISESDFVYIHFLKFFWIYLFYVYAVLPAYVHVYHLCDPAARRGQKSVRLPGTRGSKPRSCIRATSTLNYWAISPAPISCIPYVKTAEK